MRTTIAAFVFCASLGLALTPAAHATWEEFLDGSAIPAAPWLPFINEGSTTIVDVGGGNFALQMDSPAHTEGTGTHYNEYYVERFGDAKIVAGARFRLLEFDLTGKENLLSVAVGGTSAGGTTAVAPSITLVDGNYWVWSYTSDEPIFDLGPAVANEWHEAYILSRSDGTAKVRWDGTFVVDGTVPATPDFDGYLEFGSGTYWQTTAHTVAEFDWVGSGVITPGDVNEDFVVNIFDVNLVSANWGTPGGPTGDANGDGNVDIFDINLISSNWTPTGGATAVPEPASLWLAVLAVAGLIGVRRYGRR